MLRIEHGPKENCTPQLQLGQRHAWAGRSEIGIDFHDFPQSGPLAGRLVVFEKVAIDPFSAIPMPADFGAETTRAVQLQAAAEKPVSQSQSRLADAGVGFCGQSAVVAFSA
jgi:hypothetical protein